MKPSEYGFLPPNVLVGLDLLEDESPKSISPPDEPRMLWESASSLARCKVSIHSSTEAAFAVPAELAEILGSSNV